MYIIDDRTWINLKHVERIEKATHHSNIVFGMVSGKCAIKCFDTEAERDSELSSVTAIVGAL